MEIIKIENHPNVCDKVQYSLKDGKLEYVDFFLGEKVVLMEIKNVLSNLTISDLEFKMKFVSINPEVILILKALLYRIKDDVKSSELKNKIFKLHNKKESE